MQLRGVLYENYFSIRLQILTTRVFNLIEILWTWTKERVNFIRNSIFSLGNLGNFDNYEAWKLFLNSVANFEFEFSRKRGGEAGKIRNPSIYFRIFSFQELRLLLQVLLQILEIFNVSNRHLRNNFLFWRHLNLSHHFSLPKILKA